MIHRDPGLVTRRLSSEVFKSINRWEEDAEKAEERPCTPIKNSEIEFVF